MPYEYIVMDVDTGRDTPSTKHALENADIIVVVTTQSARALETTKSRASYLPKEKVMYLVNHYSPHIDELRNAVKRLGAARRDVLPLRHADVIAKLCNAGRLQTLASVIKRETLPGLERELAALSEAITKRRATR
jgi:CO dehydrogenase nickel-insertion accessory protein CooC1